MQGLVGQRGVISQHRIPRYARRKSGLGAGQIWLRLGHLGQRGGQGPGRGVKR